MMVRRLKRQVLVTFDNEKEAKGFSAFLLKRNKNSLFVELNYESLDSILDDYEKDGICDTHRISWNGKLFPLGCPCCNIEIYKMFGFTILKENGMWVVKPQGY
jgi:hypothetical protein